MVNDPEATARSVRDIFGIDGVPAPDLLQLVIRHLDEQIAEWRIEIVPSRDVPGDDARAFPERRLLRLTRGLIRRLERSDPEARYILAHELGHVVLGHREAAAFSPLAGGNSYTPDEAEEEHEANIFACEFLVPRLLVGQDETPAEVAERFCVPLFIAARAIRQASRARENGVVRDTKAVEAMRDGLKKDRDKAVRRRRGDR